MKHRISEVVCSIFYFVLLWYKLYKHLKWQIQWCENINDKINIWGGGSSPVDGTNVAESPVTSLLGVRWISHAIKIT